MIEPRILQETGEVSLYSLLQLAMAEGLDLRDVVVSYAGCGSHSVMVSALEEVTPADGTEKITLVPVDDFDPEVGF